MRISSPPVAWITRRAFSTLQAENRFQGWIMAIWSTRLLLGTAVWSQPAARTAPHVCLRRGLEKSSRASSMHPLFNKLPSVLSERWSPPAALMVLLGCSMQEAEKSSGRLRTGEPCGLSLSVRIGISSQPEAMTERLVLSTWPKVRRSRVRGTPIQWSRLPSAPTADTSRPGPRTRPLGYSKLRAELRSGGFLITTPYGLWRLHQTVALWQPVAMTKSCEFFR